MSVLCRAYELVIEDLEKAVEEAAKDYGKEVGRAVAEALDIVATRAYHHDCVGYDVVERYRMLVEKYKRSLLR